ncbi:MAG: acyl-CoA dehydrogenase family protein [Desulfitobacteriaceae bacterium]|nr:acyl-CoA dehydrogenase family protein [Desulfitobacteriaceae bacterium]MDI6914475.1 acyl-CoA dehydrogenase family protein [Desulfitobacteriaceae bacterium]
MSSDMRNIILDTARRLFGNFATPETLTSATNGVWANDLWSRLEENGFTSVDEDGLTYVDGLALLQIAGYYAVPLPLAESIIASKILVDLGLKKPDGVLSLGLIPDGEVTVGANGASISGRWRDVPWARQADAVVLCAPTAVGKTIVALVGKGDFEVEPHNNLAAEPLDVLIANEITPRAYVVIEESQQDLLVHAALTRIMQGAGALEKVLDMTIQYAGERIQFGRPIAKFQAIQQQIALMAGETAAFLVIAGKALKALESVAETNGGDMQIVHALGEKGHDGTAMNEMLEVTVLAKIRLAQAALVSPTNAHQVHGAMGFTEEYTLHHFTRRVWSYRHEYGNKQFWGDVLLAILGEKDVWEFIAG